MRRLVRTGNDDPRVTAHLEAENRYTAAATKPLEAFRDKLYKEILARIGADCSMTPDPFVVKVSYDFQFANDDDEPHTVVGVLPVAETVHVVARYHDEHLQNVPISIAVLTARQLEIFVFGSVLMVGLGSNLLVRDGGYEGTVMFTHGALKKLHVEDDGSIYAEAGVASPKVARFAATHDLHGAEFLALGSLTLHAAIGRATAGATGRDAGAVIRGALPPPVPSCSISSASGTSLRRWIQRSSAISR